MGGSWVATRVLQQLRWWVVMVVLLTEIIVV